MFDPELQSVFGRTGCSGAPETKIQKMMRGAVTGVIPHPFPKKFDKFPYLFIDPRSPRIEWFLPQSLTTEYPTTLHKNILKKQLSNSYYYPKNASKPHRYYDKNFNETYQELKCLTFMNEITLNKS